MYKKILVSILLLFINFFMLKAQVANLINYQGVAANASGSPISNSTIKIRVKIHTGSATGTIQYVEERSVTTDEGGLFNFQIGGPGILVAAGTIASVTWEQGSKFLQIEMDPNNGSSFINMGTQQLVTVPYAKVAEKITLPYVATDATSSESFKITNTLANGKAIVANTSNNTGIGVSANNTGGGVAISATNNGNATTSNTILAQNTGTNGAAVYGIANNANQKAVAGNSDAGIGVAGTSVSGYGLYGSSDYNVGISGNSANAVAIMAQTNLGTGVYATAWNNAGKALVTSGATELNGNLRIIGGVTNPVSGAVLTSDADGNATWQKQNIGFIAKATSIQNAAYGVYVTLSLNEEFDASSNFNPSSSASDPNTFIAPVSGLYEFEAHANAYILSSIYNMKYGFIGFAVNGTVNEYMTCSDIHGTGTFSMLWFDANRKIHLNAGDKVKVILAQFNENSLSGQIDQRYFSGNLVFAD